MAKRDTNTSNRMKDDSAFYGIIGGAAPALQAATGNGTSTADTITTTIATSHPRKRPGRAPQTVTLEEAATMLGLTRAGLYSLRRDNPELFSAVAAAPAPASSTPGTGRTGRPLTRLLLSDVKAAKRVVAAKRKSSGN